MQAADQDWEAGPSRKGRWPAYKGKPKGKQCASPRLAGLGRFASLFRKGRIRAALSGAMVMPPPCISMRPKRSCDPGPSISAAPGRCPLHQGQLGWNMLVPCEACIAIAFTDVPKYSHSEVVSPGISQGASSSFARALQQYAAPRSASSVPLEPHSL